MRHSKRVAATAVQQEIAQWVAWADEAPEAAAVYANRPDVQESLIHDTDQDGVIEPDAPPPAPAATISGESVDNRCTGIEGLLQSYSPGWSVERMSRYAHRESRCDPTAHNSAGAQGLFQITRINYDYLRAHGLPATDLWLRDPVNNIRAAAVLWQYSGYSPWDCCA